MKISNALEPVGGAFLPKILVAAAAISAATVARARGCVDWSGIEPHPAQSDLAAVIVFVLLLTRQPLQLRCALQFRLVLRQGFHEVQPAQKGRTVVGARHRVPVDERRVPVCPEQPVRRRQ